MHLKIDVNRSFTRLKPTMVDVLCFISLFKQSKINIAIYFHLPMNSTRWPMVPRRVSLTMGVSWRRLSMVHVLVNVPELQKQPHEINRELKCAREELSIATNVEEPIEGDRFAAAIEVDATKRGRKDISMRLSSFFRISSFEQTTMSLAWNNSMEKWHNPTRICAISWRSIRRITLSQTSLLIWNPSVLFSQ